MCHACSGAYVPHPFNCIIPPHMLEVMRMRGDTAIRKMVDEQLAIAFRTREERAERTGAEMTRDTTDSETEFVATAAAGSMSRAAPARNLDREIYDGEGKAAMPGKLVRKEGGKATGDKGADDAYDFAGAVYDLYFDAYGRNSLDGAGMKLVQTVHHRKKFNNAFWDGQQMTYGDGDGKLFQTFIEASVVGHEMTHGVVQFSGGLEYQGQSGALNESIADVFGVLVMQKMLGQSVHEADWLVGKGILGKQVQGIALRSMKAPGTAYADALLGQDPQPWHMDLFVNTPKDNGGVHINSGIPNHAFYLYCQYLGGNAWDKPGHIWYDALQHLNNPLATFHDWAAQTAISAVSLYGNGSMEQRMLKRAWKLVGVSI